MPVVLRLLGLLKPAGKVLGVTFIILLLVGMVFGTDWARLGPLIIPLVLLLIALRSASRFLHLDILSPLTRFIRARLTSRRQ